MDKLLKAREIINKTDKEIACLFEKRMEAVRLVAEYKAERGLPAFDAERENFVIENNLRYINDENIRGDYLHFLKETMNISKRFQNSLINKDKTGIITVNLGENSYEIVLQRGSLKRVGELLDIASGEKNNVGKACEYLSMVGLCAKDYINRPLDNNLSGGELKRIELAMVLAKGGKVNIFDEPEAGIDIWSFSKLTDIFASLNKMNCERIFVYIREV